VVVCHSDLDLASGSRVHCRRAHSVVLTGVVTGSGTPSPIRSRESKPTPRGGSLTGRGIPEPTDHLDTTGKGAAWRPHRQIATERVWSGGCATGDRK